jgi:hypothetical protein
MGLSTILTPRLSVLYPPHAGAGGRRCALLRNRSGIAANSLVGALFGGLVAFVLLFPLVARADLPAHHARWAMVLVGGVCVIFILGIYLLLGHLKRLRFQKGISSPIYFHTLMQQHVRRTCETLEKPLQAARFAPYPLFREMLGAKLHSIVMQHCRNMLEIIKKLNQSDFRNASDGQLERFFMTPSEYAATPLPEEIQQVAAMVESGYPQLATHLKRLKAAHKKLSYVLGDYLTAIPPTPKAVQHIRRTMPKTPLKNDTTRRILFALTVLHYLEAESDGNLNDSDRARLETLAHRRIPRLQAALDSYKAAWANLAEAYHTPERSILAGHDEE